MVVGVVCLGLKAVTRASERGAHTVWPPFLRKTERNRWQSAKAILKTAVANQQKGKKKKKKKGKGRS